MAYVLKQQQDGEENKLATGAPSGGDVAAAGGTGVAAPLRSPEESGAGGYVDIKSYLNANPEGARQLSDQVGQAFHKDVNDQIYQPLQKQTDDFRKGVSDNSTPLNAENFGVIKSAADKPEEFVKDPANVAKFNTLKNATYGGPTTFDTSTFEGAQAALQGRANAVDTRAGQKAEITKLEKNPTNGKVGLDALLLGENKDAVDNLRGYLRGNIDPLKDYLAGNKTALEKEATNAKSLTDQTRNQVAASFTGPNGAGEVLKNSLDARLKSGRFNAEQHGQQTLEKLKNLGSVPNLDPETLKELGITNDQLAGLLKERDTLRNNYGEIINPVDERFTSLRAPEDLGSVDTYAGADDYARAAALRSLGYEPGILAGDPSQAGTADLNAVDFNFGGFKDFADSTLRQKDTELVNKVLPGGIDGLAPDDPRLVQWTREWVNLPDDNGGPNTQKKRAVEAAVRLGLVSPEAAFVGLPPSDIAPIRAF